MEIQILTMECAQASDSDLSEVADLCATTGGPEMGAISKLAERWVLLSRAYADDELCGVAMSTLERIGGTPAIVMGLVEVKDGPNAASCLESLMSEQFHKAAMAFPDEDVIVAAPINSQGGFCVLSGLEGVLPGGGGRIGGEERAWGRRLAKYFEADAFDDRSMVASGPLSGMAVSYLCDRDHMSEFRAALVEDLDGDAEVYLGWGWIYSEVLDEYA